MSDVIDEIEILDVDEDNSFNDILSKESKTREDILNFTNQEIIDHTMRMVELSQTNEEYKKLKAKCEKLEHDNKVNAFKLNEYEVELRLKEEEIIALKTECSKSRKKMITIQSLLQVLVNHYGINETINIIGIPYIKLKEYLQD